MFQIIWSLNGILSATSLETGILVAVTVFFYIPLIDQISGRYILVTGCDRGFGYSLALKLDSLGCNVIATCLTQEGANKLNEASKRIVTPLMDVTDSESIARVKLVVEELVSKENKGLWAVVNNAGIIGNLGLSEWCSRKDIFTPLNVNALGTIDVNNAFLPLLRKDRGRIVNMASVAATFAAPFSGAYTISKYAVEAYSDVLRREMKIFGISVHIIEPGATSTDFIDTDNITKTAEQVWNRLPQSVKKVYGEDYLQKGLEYTLLLTKLTSASTTEHVIEAYTRALLGKYPRIRYTVGIDANLYLILAKLPDWMADLLFTTFRMPPKAVCY